MGAILASPFSCPTDFASKGTAKCEGMGAEEAQASTYPGLSILLPSPPSPHLPFWGCFSSLGEAAITVLSLQPARGRGLGLDPLLRLEHHL